MIIAWRLLLPHWQDRPPRWARRNGPPGYWGLLMHCRNRSAPGTSPPIGPRLTDIWTRSPEIGRRGLSGSLAAVRRDHDNTPRFALTTIMVYCQPNPPPTQPRSLG
jgi:hypothetical protein